MKILLSIFCSLAVSQAYAKGDPGVMVDANEVQKNDVEFYTQRAEGCGENADNLLCYFTPEEIQKALGLSATEALARGLLDPNNGEKFAYEETVEFEYQTAGRQGIGASKRSAYKRRSSKNPKALPRGDVRALVGMRSGSGAPVWGKFIATMKSCKPGCVPVDFNAFRGGAFSCHNSGRAIDVGGIACEGKTHFAYYQGEYSSLVSCARQSRMKVLYRDGKGDLTSGHYNHGHFSIGCRHPKGHGYW